MTFSTILELGVQISLFLVVVSYGMRASVSDMLDLFRYPGRLLSALFSISVIMPAFVALLIALFPLNPAVEVALVAIAVSPVPLVLSVNEFGARGDTRFTYGLVSAISLLSLFVIPMAFRLLHAVFGREESFSEAFITKTIFFSLTLPLLTGMAIRGVAPGYSRRHAVLYGAVGLAMLIVSMVPLLPSLFLSVLSLMGNGTVLAIIGFTFVGVTVGHTFAGPDVEDRIALAMATVSRHPAISIALVSANGGAEANTGMAAIVLYLIVSGFVIIPYLHWLSGHKPRYGFNR